MSQQESGRTSRRRMLEATSGAVLGLAALNRAAEAAETPVATKGRIKQSIVHWCFADHWDVARDDQGRQGARLRQHRAHRAEVLPPAQGGRPRVRHRDDRHGPGPAVRQGVQQPQAPRSGHQGHARRHRRLLGVRVQERDLLHGDERRHPRRRRRVELRRGVQAGHRPRREEGRDALPGDAQHARHLAPDEGAPGLPGGPHRVLRRHHQARRLAAPEAALRHLPRPDHGRRRHPPDPPAQGRHRPRPHGGQPRPRRARRPPGDRLQADHGGAGGGRIQGLRGPGVHPHARPAGRAQAGRRRSATSENFGVRRLDAALPGRSRHAADRSGVQPPHSKGPVRSSRAPARIETMQRGNDMRIDPRTPRILPWAGLLLALAVSPLRRRRGASPPRSSARSG